MIGSIIDRVHLFKLFLCYELLFIIISIILVLHSYTSYVLYIGIGS